MVQIREKDTHLNNSAYTCYVLCAHTCRLLYDAVSAAIAGGATMVQIREKETDGGDFLAGVKSVLPVS